MRRRDRPYTLARWLSPTLQASPSAIRLRTLIADIGDTLLANEPKRTRQRKAADLEAWRACVEAVVCNCIGLAPGEPVHFLLSPRRWVPSRYLPTPFGCDTLKAVLETMHGEYLAADVSAWRGKASTLRPSGELLGMLEAFTLADVREAVEPETIILTGDDLEAKSRGARLRLRLPYTDTPDTVRYRDDMRVIGEAFVKAPIWFHDDGLGPVHTDRRALRRCFNTLPGHEHLQWQCGGRIYSEWLSNLDRERRRSSLFLDDPDRRAVECDWSGLHLRIASAEAGVPLPPDVDPYAIDGLKPLHRPALKIILNAMLTARGTLHQRPEKVPSSFPKDWTMARVREAVLRAHPHLESVLGARPKDALPPAYRLQWVESEMLVDVLLECGRRGLTALPLHDAVLVPEGRQEEAREVMLEAGARRGLAVPVGVKGTGGDARTSDPSPTTTVPSEEVRRIGA